MYFTVAYFRPWLKLHGTPLEIANQSVEGGIYHSQTLRHLNASWDKMYAAKHDETIQQYLPTV